MKILLFTLFLTCSGFISAQYASAAGTPSSSAISKDSTIIVAWATHCLIDRGRVNISDLNSSLASYGQDSDAIGPADETTIVSLGDSGVAILTFANGIFNGTGPDFAIFENSFNDSFLELAHVEVSSDGINFHRFPSDFLLAIPQIGGFDQLGVPEKMNNLAGKYRGGFGTPFDLEELIGINGLDVNNVTHVKIIDVVGQISTPHGSTDQNGNYINDPFPTPFPSSGFDLDAVGVMYQTGVNDLTIIDLKKEITIFPNPFSSTVSIFIDHFDIKSIELYSATGAQILSTNKSTIYTENLSPGIYILNVILTDDSVFSERIIKL